LSRASIAMWKEPRSRSIIFSTGTSLGDPCERRDQAMRQYYAGLVSFVGTIQDLQRLDDLALFHPRSPRAAAAPAR
jgi:hypothetical protein